MGPMKLRVYLDTSVFNAVLDAQWPDRRDVTLRFFDRLADFDVATSEVARSEISDTRDPARRTELLALLERVNVIEVTEEMKELAWNYVRHRIFTARMLDDARHVAAAVVTRQDVLLSWNFRHLVNRRRRAMINELNLSRYLPRIDIVSPMELAYE